MIIPPGTAMGTPVVPEVKKPMAETVNLEMVWAAVYAAYYANCGYTTSARDTAEVAQEAVDNLLAAFPRGGQ